MIYLLTIGEFIGRFHPLLVHLPIGFLLLSVIFYFLSRKEKFQSLRTAVFYSLLLGTVAAVLSSISGLLLSQSGEYDETLVSRHQWFGIGLTVICFTSLYAVKKSKLFTKWLMLLIAVLIAITGHLGGTLTHGENYLFASNNKQQASDIKPIPDIQQAIVYTDIIKPILQSKCYSCHSATKQKGKLRLDEPSFLIRGGETGNTILAGKADESELIKRILLPETNEDHMPPAKKPQLTKAQIELLHWWIQQGADFTKPTVALQQPEKVKPLLAALQSGSIVTATIIEAESILPEKEVIKAPDSLLQQLRQMDISVSPVAKGSNYLSVSFVGVDSITDKQLGLLKKISEQVIWLKMSSTNSRDEHLHIIGQMKSLTRLYLDKTQVTDRGIAAINGLSLLQYLNISFTNVNISGLEKLGLLKKLKQLYVYKTSLTAMDVVRLNKIFPLAQIDTGGYHLQKIPTDTMLVKAPK